MTSNSTNLANGDSGRASAWSAGRTESSGRGPALEHPSAALGSAATMQSEDGRPTPLEAAASFAAGVAKALLSAALLLAFPVSLGMLYLAYLAFIPPCSTSAWYNCPPDPATTVGLGIMALAVPVVVIGAIVTMWAPRFRRRWGGWVLLAAGAVVFGMWLIFSAVP